MTVRDHVRGWAPRGRALLAAARARRSVAIAATLCIAVPLVVVALLDSATHAVVAAQGGFAGFSAAGEPYRRRARIVALIGLGLVAAMALGTVCAPSAVAVAVCGAVFCTVAAAWCLAARVGPPREYFVVFTFLIASGLPEDTAAVGERSLLVLGGVAVAWAIALSGMARDRHGPERAAVARAFAAVERLVGAVGRDAAEVAAAQHDAVVAVSRAVAMTADGGDAGLARRAEAAEAQLEAAQALVVEGPGSAAARERLAAARRQASEAVAGAERRGVGAGAVRRSWREAVRDAVAPPSHVPTAAARVGLVVGIGVLVGDAVGGAHGYWIPLSAAAVLQSTNVSLTLRRAADRAVGTAVGVVLAAAVLAPEPSLAAMIVLLVVFQLLTESVIVASYGLAVVFITSLSLLMLEIAHPEFEVTLLGARLLDTVLGCALGAAAGLLLWRRRSALGLPAAQAAALRASGAALAAGLRAAPPDELRGLRHDARAALLELRAVQRDATGDDLRAAGEADRRWPLTHAVEQLGVLAASLPPDRTDPPRAAPLAAAVTALADAAEHGTRAPTDLPSLPHHPRTAAALAHLRAAADELATASR